MEKKKLMAPSFATAELPVIEKEFLGSSYNAARYEYLLIISPPKVLYDKIREVKRAFQEKYQAGFSGKPHITLVKFVQWNTMEEKIVHRLSNISATFKPFLVQLDGFSSFPTHTIYINITTKNNIREVVKSLHPVQSFMKSKDFDPHFITEPHFTIARKLLPSQFEKGWQEYQQLHFTARFIADRMLLIRKKEGNKYYEEVKEFYFLHQSNTPVQGSLFQ
jgi:2'-5' RNA ligase